MTIKVSDLIQKLTAMKTRMGDVPVWIETIDEDGDEMVVPIEFIEEGFTNSVGMTDPDLPGDPAIVLS